ncbi:hypothetical protein RFI_14146, partial [Reticulomyxa filosa]
EAEQSTIKWDEIPETLDFKRHWCRNWRRANVEAAKIVEEMMHDNEQGLIIVTYNTLKWKNKNDNLATLNALVNDEKNDIKEFGEYYMYVIKRKLIVLETINIDGSVYAIGCELQCKGDVNITTQLFVTKNAVIDKQLMQTLSTIQWNTQTHYCIPLLLQDLEHKENECSNKKLFDESLVHEQKYLQIAIDTFGSSHHYVAIAYNLLGITYDNKGQPEQAIEFFEKALKIAQDIFGIKCNFVSHLYFNVGVTYNKKNKIFGVNHVDVAQSYNNLGNAYKNKGQHSNAIECHEQSLKIRSDIFGVNHDDVAKSYIKLGGIYQNNGQQVKSTKCYEKALEIRLEIFGQKHVDVAWSYHHLGVSYEKIGQYNKAIESYDKALQIRLSIFGMYHVDVSESYLCLGLAYIYESIYDKAIECHKTLLEIKKKTYTKGDPTIGALCNLLGLEYKIKGEMKTACRYYEDAWKVYSLLHGEWHASTLGSKKKMIELSIS